MASNWPNRLITDERFLPLWETVAWNAVENCVMYGELEISKLTDEEIVVEAFQLHLSHLGEDPPDDDEEVNDEAPQKAKLQWSTNHEKGLKRQGDEFLSEGEWEFATLFYATWIEHWLNRIILLRSIGMGMPPELATALIRSTRIELKMGKVWTSLGAPRFPRDLARRVTRVMESRNGFVHYKWPSAEEEEHDASIARAESEAREAKQTIEALISFEDLAFYGGRTQSIKEALRRDWCERRRQAIACEESQSGH